MVTAWPAGSQAEWPLAITGLQGRGPRPGLTSLPGLPKPSDQTGAAKPTSSVGPRANTLTQEQRSGEIHSTVPWLSYLGNRQGSVGRLSLQGGLGHLWPPAAADCPAGWLAGTWFFTFSPKASETRLPLVTYCSQPTRVSGQKQNHTRPPRDTI